MPPNGMPTPGTPAPNPTPAPTPTPVAKTPDPAPSFSGSVRIATFTDIVTTGDAKKPSGSQVDTAKVEAALKRVSGVSSVSVDNTGINVGFSGPYSEIKKLKIAVETQGVSSEVLSPARVIVRPMSQIEDATAALNALKGVSGVAATEKESNDLVVYADLSTVSLESLLKAVEGTGVKCQIASHEEIKVKYSAAGQTEQLKSDLAATKWVLKADVDAADSAVKVVAVKGRVTRSVIKSVMAKHGFPEAK